MFTPIKKKIKGKWNHLLRRSSGPKIRGKYFFFEGNEENYIKNGARVLEESISLFHGKTNPIRHFSVNDLNNMKVERVPNPSMEVVFLNKRTFQGYWEGKVVLLVYANIEYPVSDKPNLIREIIIATQMVTHNNSHKILGCCLETIDPAIVYEWVAPKTLEECIVPINEKYERESLLEWKDRLRIAWEISHCVSYLHTAFPRPIIHRNINLKNVFLDMDKSAKLSGYSLSISIPEGEEFVEDVIIGSMGYIDDVYLISGQVRKSTDVYSFGMFLLALLSGKRTLYRTTREDNYHQTINLLDLARDCIKNKCINEIIDPVMTKDGVTTFEDFQFQTTFHLALSCTGPQEERPTMEEVAIQLKNMITSPEPISLPDGHQ